MDPIIDSSIGSESQPGIFTKFSLETDLQTHNNNTEDAHAHEAAQAALLAHEQGDYHFEDGGDSSPNDQIIDHENEETASVDAAVVAAAAAAHAEAATANLSSIINFNEMDQDSTDPPASDLHSQHSHSGMSSHEPTSTGKKHQSQLSFLQNALSISRSTDEVPSSTISGTTSTTSEPKQVLFKDPTSKMSIVVVNPASKDGTGRVGRPRRSFEKNQDKSTKTLMESSSSNMEECLVSKFRVDSRPVVGPGSRGGKLKPAPKKIEVPRFVNFSVGKGDVLKATVGEYDPPQSPQPISNDTTKDSDNEDYETTSAHVEHRQGPTQAEPVPIAAPSRQLVPLLPYADPSTKQTDDDSVHTASHNISSQDSPKLTNSFILEDYASLKAKGRSVQKDKQDVFAKLGLVPLMPKKPLIEKQQPVLSSSSPILATTPATPRAAVTKSVPEKKVITRQRRPKPAITKHRDTKRKDIPGPLTPAFWDLYDPEILKLDELEDKSEDRMVALGYSVKPAPYAKDIMMILSFIAKFKKFFPALPNLGPQDFEEGLWLDTPEKYDVENSKQIVNVVAPHEDAYVSDNMNLLLRSLLTLVLNRKKIIPKSGTTKALFDLKELVLNFGLPAEWRDDTGVYAPPATDESLKNPEDEEPVDPDNNEFFDTIQYQYGTTKPLDHTPLDNGNFETEGLQSLKPFDRLVLLRSMVHWCCANSDAVRKEINDQITRQDASGEKETYYLSRFIKDGDEGVNGANRSLKLHPRKKIKKVDDSANIAADAYTDASVNPMDHHLSFRLLDFYAGDGGVVGRFYLCRSADSTNGGFASVQELKDLYIADKSTKDMLAQVQPSRFKLYVEDVTTLLGSLLEVETSLIEEKKEAFDAWYEIAGNSTELANFVEFLGKGLENLNSKNLQNLHDYLKSLVPMLQKYESVYTEYTALTVSRDARKRSQVTDLKANDRKLRKIIKNNEKPEDEFLRDDDDGSDEDMEDGGDEEEFDIGQEPDDADDDDYRD